jgi:hypothetical protein
VDEGRVRFFSVCHPVEAGLVTATGVEPELVNAFKQTFVFGWDNVRSVHPAPLLLM